MTAPQRINLYQPEFHPRRDWLGLTGVTTLAVVFILALVVITWLMQRRLTQMEEEVNHLTRQEEAVMLRLSDLTGRRPAQAAFEAEALAQEGTRAFLDLLEETRQAHGVGFSAALAGMGEARVEGVWLTRISLERGGAALTLEGRTRSAERLPEYVRALLSHPALQGRALDGVRVQESPAGEERAFHLYSTGKAAEQDGEASMETPTGGFL